MTLDDLRFRFLSTVKQVSADQLAAMTQFDRRRTENFLAFADGSPSVIATAMLVCDDALDVGEVAIAIRAEDKNKGVGWELLRHITRYAEAKDVKSLESLESRANHQAIALEKELGFVAQSYPDDASLVLVRRQLKAA